MTKVKKSKIGYLPLTLLTIVTVGGGYYFGRNLLGSELTPKSSAKITPQSAFVTSYISTTTEEWSKLDQFASPTNQKIIGENLEDFVDDKLKDVDNNLNYQKDIAPWIGGISFTLLPSSSTSIDFHPVAIIGLKNKFKAWRFFHEQKEKIDTEVETKKYKNIAVYNVINNNIWATIFDNYLIVSDSEDGIQQILDTYKGEASLAQLDSKNFSAKNSLFQVYLPQYDRFFLKAIANFLPSANSDKLSQLQSGKVNSMTINVNIEDYGFNFQTIFDLDEKIAANNNNTLEPISDTLLAQIPQETILMFNGGNFDKIWQNIENNQKNIPELDKFISEAKKLVSKKLNLDLENDFINWLDGEFIFSISNVSKTQVQGSLLLQSSNQKQGNITLNYLTDRVRRLPSVKVKQNNIKGINVTELTNFRRNLLSYGWLNNNSLLVTFATDFQEVINVNRKNSLLNNETFQITTQSLPQENYGYFYLDLQKTIDTAKNLNPPVFNNAPPDVKAISESLKAIAITSSSPNPNTAQLDINLSLQKYDQ